MALAVAGTGCDAQMSGATMTEARSENGSRALDRDDDTDADRGDDAGDADGSDGSDGSDGDSGADDVGEADSSATGGDLGEDGDSGSNDSDDGDLTEEELARCKLDEDFVELKYPDKIQKCIDDGSLFDFAADRCFDDVKKATSYECNWAAVKSAIVALNIPGDDGTTLKDQYPDAKILGCGERRDGKTIVLQVWIPPKRELNKKDCSYKESMSIGAECHAFTSGAAIGGDAAQGVSDCVKAD
jgi:hypothetical protein